VTAPPYDVRGRASSLGGPALRRALTEDADGWLAGLLADGLGGQSAEGVALVAVGGYGRRELAPGSDLDILLLHDPARTDAAALAEPLWYSVWDAGVGLDHSLRTPEQALDVAAGDLKVALGLLDLRHVAGDAALTAGLRLRVLEAWRRTATRRLPELRGLAGQRAERSGELAFLLEPDLKEARGGLRDALIPWHVAAAQLADPPGEAERAAGALLLDVRGALHAGAVVAGRRAGDRLLLQDQDAVAARLGLSDADGLMRAVAGAARRTARGLELTWRRVSVATPAPTTRWQRLRGRGGAHDAPVREPLAEGVVSQGGEVVLARGADPRDPLLALRAARAAAASGLPLSPYALRRLAEPGPLVPDPWPTGLRDAFVALLGAGQQAVAVIEELDDVGLWERYLPEWPRLRSKPQRNAFHRFTVDRHVLETAAGAAALTRSVSRPDLLLLAALLHDLGKGWPGDHTEVGVRVVPPVLTRMGLDDRDVSTVTTLVRCHLLLAEAATQRDLADPATARSVAAAVGTAETLELLRALTEADSLATGPAMWSRWKAGLLDELVHRVAAVLVGAAPVGQRPLSGHEEALLAAAATGVVAVEPAEDGAVLLAAPDVDGLLGHVAAALALNRLDIRALDARGDGAAALVRASVTPRFGRDPDWPAVTAELRRAVAGAGAAAARRLQDRSAEYPAPHRSLAAAPAVLWPPGASATATVVELRAPDSVGLLARAAAALADAGLLLRAARCATLGVEVVDAFYVVERDGSPLDGRRRAEVGALLLAAGRPGS